MEENCLGLIYNISLALFTSSPATITDIASSSNVWKLNGFFTDLMFLITVQFVKFNLRFAHCTVSKTSEASTHHYSRQTGCNHNANEAKLILSLTPRRVFFCKLSYFRNKHANLHQNGNFYNWFPRLNLQIYHSLNITLTISQS